MKDLKFLSKFTLSLKKPSIIVAAGNGKKSMAQAIFKILDPHFKVKKMEGKISNWDLVKNQILITEFFTQFSNSLNPLLKKAFSPMLIVTAAGEIPPYRKFFSADPQKVKGIKELVKSLAPHGWLILNFDDETVRSLQSECAAKTLTFGLQSGADFQGTDIKLNRGTNFKLNYQGNIVPVWLEKLFGKKQVYTALGTSAVGTKFGLNLVEISKLLKGYQGISGEMKLIKGKEGSFILDDSRDADVSSMRESLKILKEIEGFKRKIAVLGDVVGIGKYTTEAHEFIGEEVKDSTDLLVTVGSRARFIAKGAFIKGMEKSKIFRFDQIRRTLSFLEEKIKPGDLVLVDASKEMKMETIVDYLVSV